MRRGSRGLPRCSLIESGIIYLCIFGGELRVLLPTLKPLFSSYRKIVSSSRESWSWKRLFARAVRIQVSCARMDEVLWARVYSFLCYPEQPDPCCKLHAVAIGIRAARPYFLTAICQKEPHDDPSLQSEGIIRSAARSVGQFVMRAARRLRNPSPCEEQAADEIACDFSAEEQSDDDDDSVSGVGDAETVTGASATCSTRSAVRELLRSTPTPAAPHLVLVFCCGAWKRKLEDIRTELRAALPAWTTIVGGGAPGVLCSTAAHVCEVEPGCHSAIALALIRCAETPTVSALFVPSRRDPHSRDAHLPPSGSLGADPTNGGDVPRFMFVFAQDHRAAREALAICEERKRGWLACGEDSPAIVGGILGGEFDSQLVLDCATEDVPLLPAPVSADSCGEHDPGAVVITLANRHTRAASAASRGARVVGPSVYRIGTVFVHRPRPCPGHFVELRSVGALQPIASRNWGDFGEDAFEKVDGADLVTPESTIRSVAEFENGLPQTLFFGIKHVSKDLEPAKWVNGYSLARRHVDEDGALVIQGPVAADTLGAWHSLCPRASCHELRAAACACRVDLRIERGDGHLPLQQGIDSDLSVVGGVVFTCSGRGTGFHDEPLRDSRSLREDMPHLPLIGVFANGEIGPPPYNELGGGTSATANSHVTGYTCQSVILRLDGAVCKAKPG